MRLYWQWRTRSRLGVTVYMLVFMVATTTALLFALLFAAPAFAKPADLQAAIARAKTTYHAKVLNAETINNNGHAAYRLKLLFKDGHVKTVIVDAENGNDHRGKRGK